jgi:hypothetical protein
VWIYSHPVALPPIWLPLDDVMEIRYALPVAHHGAAKDQIGWMEAED